MTEERLNLLLNQAYLDLDKEQYPEIYENLSFYRNNADSFYFEDAKFVAQVLFSCDETKVLPPFIAQLIKEIYLDLIEDGDCDAANDLGVLYYTGRIGTKNYTQAMNYYKLAAKEGSRVAQENLGYCYYYGRDTEKDYEKAFHYFALGAFDGQLRSLYKIGDMYRNGYYVEKNPKEAFFIYKRCEETLTREAEPIVGADIMMRLGDCFHEAIGCEKDLNSALEYYQKAEQLFYKRLVSGDFLIQNCYTRVIQKQVEVREEMIQLIPDYSWTE